MRCDCIGSGRGVGSVNAGCRVFSGHLAASAAPAVSHGVLRTEIAGRDGGGDRLPDQHFGRLY